MIIPVADVDGQIDFYVEKLGFESASTSRSAASTGGSRSAPPGARPRLRSRRRRRTSPTRATARRASACTRLDIDGYYEQLKSSGVDVDAEISRMGDPVPPMFWLRDPEGNSLMVVG